jgi:ParB family transcriptional regulator, chromosome partitioning protein
MARNWRKPGGADALAKGLQGTDLLFGGDGTQRDTVSLRLGDVEPNPDQPRRFFDVEELNQLASSLQAVGQLSPVLVKVHPSEPHRYLLIAGERRWRAAGIAGMTHIQAHILPGDADLDQIALIENLQRINLSPVEEAEGIQRLIDKHGYSQEQAGGLLGRSRTEINTTLSLLRLAPAVRRECVTSHNVLPKALLLELARMPSREQAEAWERAKSGELTVRTARAERKAVKAPSAPPQPVDAAARALARFARLQSDLATVSASPATLAELPADRLAVFRGALVDALAVVDQLVGERHS